MGKSAGAGTELNNYHASVASIHSVGEDDALEEYIVDGESIYKPSTPIDLTIQANPYKFTIADRGFGWIYRGTAVQTIGDPVLQASLLDHANMRGLVVVILEDFLMGLERTSVVDALLITRSAPKQSVITGDAALLDSSGQCNALAYAAEMLTADLDGLGQDADAVVDLPSWQAIADVLYADSQYSYISPMLRDRAAYASLLEDLQGYNDLWFRQSSEGKIEVGMWAQGEETPLDLPVITEHDLRERSKPRTKSIPRSGLPSEFEVVWTNPTLAYEEDTAPFSHGKNRLKTSGDVSPTIYQRPGVQRGKQALRMAARLGTRDGRPYRTKSFVMRESIVEKHGLRPGDAFIFAYTQTGHADVYRVTEMRGWRIDNPYVTVTAEEERGYYPGAGWADFVDAVFDDETEPDDLDYWHALQATDEMADSRHRLMVLAGRTDGLLTGFNLYLKAASEEYQLLGQARRWAVPVSLSADYAVDATGPVEISQLSAPTPFGWDQLPTSMTEDELLDDFLLLIVIDTAEPELYEAMSVELIGSPVADAYPVTALPGRLGTARRAHSAGDRAYLILRSALVYMGHSQIALLGKEDAAEDRVIDLKAQPFNYRNLLALEDATAKQLQLADTFVSPPANMIVQSTVGGFVITFDVLDSNVVGADVWVSASESAFAVEPTFTYSITSREAVSGRIVIPYFNAIYLGAATDAYFKVRLFDDERETNYSEISEVVYSGSFGSISQGPRVVLTADWWFRYGNARGFELQAVVRHASGLERYEWFRYPIDSDAGPPTLMFGESTNRLSVPITDVRPTGEGPSYRRYRVQVNGAQYDETTLHSYVYDLSTPDNGDVRIVWQDNEMVTIDVDDDYHQLGGQLSPFSWVTNSVVRMEVPGKLGIAVEAADIDSFYDYYLVLPSGLNMVPGRLDAFYLSDATALSADLSDTVFNVEVWSWDEGTASAIKIADLTYTVRKYQKLVDLPHMDLYTVSGGVSNFNDPSRIINQPITNEDTEIYMAAKRGGEQLALASIAINISDAGAITVLYVTGDTDEIVVDYEYVVLGDRGKLSVTATHTLTGATRNFYFNAELDVSEPLPLSAGLGEALTIVESSSDSSDLSLGEGEDGSTL